MKLTILRMILPFYCFLGSTICLVVSCNTNVICQSPPPSFLFQVISNNTTYPAPADTSATLTISYLDGIRKKNIIDLRVSEGLFTSSEMIERSWTFNNPEFTITLNGQELTRVRFDTYMNNDKCQGWASLSNVYEDNVLIPRTENRFYVLGEK